MKYIYLVYCKDRYNNLVFESAYPSEDMAKTVVNYLRENYKDMYRDIDYEEVLFYDELNLPEDGY